MIVLRRHLVGLVLHGYKWSAHVSVARFRKQRYRHPLSNPSKKQNYLFRRNKHADILPWCMKVNGCSEKRICAFHMYEGESSENLKSVKAEHINREKSFFTVNRGLSFWTPVMVQLTIPSITCCSSTKCGCRDKRLLN